MLEGSLIKEPYNSAPILFVSEVSIDATLKYLSTPKPTTKGFRSISE